MYRSKDRQVASGPTVLEKEIMDHKSLGPFLRSVGSAEMEPTWDLVLPQWGPGRPFLPCGSCGRQSWAVHLTTLLWNFPSVSPSAPKSSTGQGPPALKIDLGQRLTLREQPLTNSITGAASCERQPRCIYCPCRLHPGLKSLRGEHLGT